MQVSEEQRRATREAPDTVPVGAGEGATAGSPRHNAAGSPLRYSAVDAPPLGVQLPARAARLPLRALAATVQHLEHVLTSSTDQTSFKSAATELFRIRATIRLLRAVGAPEGTTLVHLMATWRDAEGATRSNNSPAAQALNSSRKDVTTEDFKKTLALAARAAPREPDTRARHELTEYLRRAFAHENRFHPLTSPAIGKGDSSAGALVDAIEPGTKDELATGVARFFDAFSSKGQGAQASKMPR